MYWCVLEINQIHTAGINVVFHKSPVVNSCMYKKRRHVIFSFLCYRGSIYNALDFSYNVFFYLCFRTPSRILFYTKIKTSFIVICSVPYTLPIQPYFVHKTVIIKRLISINYKEQSSLITEER